MARQTCAMRSLCVLTLSVLFACDATDDVQDGGPLDSEFSDASGVDGGHADAFEPECSGFADCPDPSRPLCAQVTEEGEAARSCNTAARVACAPRAAGCVCVVGPPDPAPSREPGVTGLFCFD